LDCHLYAHFRSACFKRTPAWERVASEHAMNPDSPMSSALRGFGEAAEKLLLCWLDSLSPEHVRKLDFVVLNGGLIGVRVMVGPAEKAATLELLVTDQDGAYHVASTIVHDFVGPLQ